MRVWQFPSPPISSTAIGISCVEPVQDPRWQGRNPAPILLGRIWLNICSSGAPPPLCAAASIQSPSPPTTRIIASLVNIFYYPVYCRPLCRRRRRRCFSIILQDSLEGGAIRRLIYAATRAPHSRQWRCCRRLSIILSRRIQVCSWRFCIHNVYCLEPLCG